MPKDDDNAEQRFDLVQQKVVQGDDESTGYDPPIVDNETFVEHNSKAQGADVIDPAGTKSEKSDVITLIVILAVAVVCLLAAVAYAYTMITKRKVVDATEGS